MSDFPSSSDLDPIGSLIKLLNRLPGVGERSATRLAFFLLSQDRNYAQALAHRLAELHDRVHKCIECNNYGSESRCSICNDERRDKTILCVVANVQDLIAVERTASYRGIYHVLHKLLSPLDGVHPDDLHVEQLKRRIETLQIKEIIVATPLSVEGEATALFLAQTLRGSGCHVSRIASGLPHGGELEFTDQITLNHAFEGRKAL
ncbi:MAG: recombination protein RecR [Myxococcales bacterium]|nr:MAG: recombination protein RecR [Myxococcales bacterium]